MVRINSSNIYQLPKDEFQIISSYIYQETGNLKLADNKYFIEKIIDQVHYLPENISIKTKKFLREK